MQKAPTESALYTPKPSCLGEQANHKYAGVSDFDVGSDKLQLEDKSRDLCQQKQRVQS